MTDEYSRLSGRISAPVWLTALLLAVLIPFIAFTAYSVGELNRNLRRNDGLRMIERADSLSANVDREIRGMISLADALANSPYLQEVNLGEFHRYAALSRPSPTTHMILVDRSLQQLSNTRVPFGTELPKITASDAVSQALGSNRPVISNVVVGRVSNRKVFNVNVPVSVNGQTPYVLIVTDEPPRITRVLVEQGLQQDWRSAVIDGKGEIIASDEPMAASTGQFPMGTLKGNGRVETVLGGQDVVMQYVKSELTGWTSVVWVPVTTLNAPSDALWKTLTAVSLIALLASSALAFLFARPFAGLMRDTLKNVSLLGTLSDMPPIKSFLHEGTIISRSLQRVNRQLLDRQKENEEGSALLLSLLDNVPEGITIVGGPDLEIIASSRQALEWLGYEINKPDIHPAAGAEVLSVKNLDGSVPDAEQMPLYRASRNGESVKFLQLTLERADGTKMPIEMSVNPFRDRSGKIIGAVSCWHDITERKQAEQTLRLITRELTHRAKNLLTVILGIAKQTARPDMTIQDFLSVFTQRIQGLGASHDLLTHSDWGGAQLEELVVSQLSPFGSVDGNRIRINGPKVLLKNDVLQTLGLAFHELATNAVKYGALSVEAGSVDISWSINSVKGEYRLTLVWKERGGPAVHEPVRKGFGHNITVRSLARVVSGEVKIEFAKTGVVWTLDAPLPALALDKSGTV